LQPPASLPPAWCVFSSSLQPPRIRSTGMLCRCTSSQSRSVAVKWPGLLFPRAAVVMHAQQRLSSASAHLQRLLRRHLLCLITFTVHSVWCLQQTRQKRASGCRCLTPHACLCQQVLC
jgi:hypothetical protein